MKTFVPKGAFLLYVIGRGGQIEQSSLVYFLGQKNKYYLLPAHMFALVKPNCSVDSDNPINPVVVKGPESKEQREKM